MLRRRVSASGISLAIHFIVIALVVWAPIEPVESSGDGGGSGGSVVAVYPWEPRPPATQEPSGDLEAMLDVEDEGGEEVLLPGFSFDIRKIAKNADELFPFLAAHVKLQRILPRDAEPTARTPFVSPLAPPAQQRRPSSNPPLAMSGPALQQLVDKAWSRRNRWAAFRPIATLLVQHDPDTGDLPVVLREYLDQNLLQPYVDTSIRDPRFWTLLAIAADNADFVRFIATYEARHPSTRTTTELLFLLDELVQGNLEGLATLLDTDMHRDLRWTRVENPRAYELATSIWEEYTEAVAQRGLTNRVALRLRYDDVRLGILASIVRTTPAAYRLGDAHFLAGSVYWRQGRRHEALAEWRRIRPDRSDTYFTVYSELLDFIRDHVDVTAPLVAPRVDGILAAETRRWADFSRERLRQFGYAFDTF
jgi:hypothetical protein